MKNLVHENILGLKDVIYIPHEGEILGKLYWLFIEIYYMINILLID